MSSDQRLATIENKLDLLLAHFVPAEEILDAELEAQYLKASDQVSANPALIREFVQQHPLWVADRNKKAA